MARTMETHCDDLLRVRREEQDSERRIQRACATLPVTEAEKVAQREFANQRDLHRSAQEAVKEQIDRG